MDKLAVGRAQLGTALHLFIEDRDPIAVQALAVGGCAIIDGLAEKAGKHRMAEHVTITNPGTSPKEFYRLRNQYWNAIKHVSVVGGEVRNDDDTLVAFTDWHNDIALFVGWHDYMLLVERMPIEAQVFQIWWYAANPGKMDPQIDDLSATFFPDLPNQSRREQKSRLSEAVAKYRNDPEVMSMMGTERAPLSQDTVYLADGSLPNFQH